MDNKVKLSTLNIRGLNSKEKVLYLKEFLMKYKIDICFLQETHIYKKQELLFLEETLKDYDIKTMICESKCRGVAILVRKADYLKINNIEYDDENRIFCVNVRIQNKDFNLINIYAPNLSSEQNDFIEKLYDYVGTKKRVILAGDFNFVTNKYDRSGDTTNKDVCEKSNVKNWKKFYNILSMNELKDSNNENQITKMMTWTNGSQSSRIDRIYIKKDIDISIKYTDNCLFSMSDHRMITCELSFENTSPKNKPHNSWKLNESILEYDDVNEKIIDFCNQIPKFIRKFNIGWYDKFINFVANYLKIVSREKFKERKQEINNMFDELNILDKSDSENDEIISRKNELKSKIKEYFKNKIQGIEKRTCDDRMRFVKQPSKSLINREVNKAKKCSIDRYKKENGEIATDNKEILDDVYKFYTDLMGTEKVKHDDIKDYEFNIQSLSDSDRKLFLDYEITYEEALKVVNEMDESAPGPNGLTVGFYKKYFPYFGRYFVCILNNYENKLPECFNESRIKLIPKNDNKIKTVNDLRPISLTNFEYRIFTKILVNRFRAISHKIIGEHQTCSILGRKINDNIDLIRDIIEDANVRKKMLYLISVDQRKAFDSISHAYLYRLIEHMNFGEFMCASIRRIYENSYARIELNKLLGDKFKILAGIKQGCALSMFLYVLAIEILLISINLNEKIKGYKLNITKSFEVKTSAYADDVAGLVTDEQSIKEFFNSFKEWGKISGASMNEDKTNILSINVNEEYSTLKFVSEMKLLGVVFNKLGISDENLKKTETKIEQTLGMWQCVNLNTLERIVVCKTFALSKLWYIASFMIVPEKYIKKYESIIYKFIWNGAIEYIKRDTLILPLDQGGLNMFSIRAKFETILFQQFKHITFYYDKQAYQISVYWLKFHLRELNLKNFNLIPCGNENVRPMYYERMIDVVKNIKKQDKNLFKNIESYSSKKTYQILAKKYYIKPNLENTPLQIEWVKVYKNIHNLKDSNVRTVNYKVLMDALPLNNRIVKNKDKCYFCKKQVEDRDHLFINCRETQNLFSIVRSDLEVKMYLSSKSIILQENQSQKDFLNIAYFKFIIWRIRNILRTTSNTNAEALFRKYWNKWLISKTNT